MLKFTESLFKSKKKSPPIYSKLLKKAIIDDLTQEEFEVYRADIAKFIPIFKSIFHDKSLEKLESYENGNFQDLLANQSAGSLQKNTFNTVVNLIMSRYFDPENVILENLEREHQIIFKGDKISPFERFYLKKIADLNLIAIPLHKITWDCQKETIAEDEVNNFIELIDAVSGPNLVPSQLYWTLNDRCLASITDEQLIDFFKKLSIKGIKALYTPGLNEESIARLIQISQSNNISLLHSDDRVDIPVLSLKEELQAKIQEEDFTTLFEQANPFGANTSIESMIKFLPYLERIKNAFGLEKIERDFYLDYSDDEFDEIKKNKFLIEGLLMSFSEFSGNMYVKNDQIKEEIESSKRKLLTFFDKLENDCKSQINSKEIEIQRQEILIISSDAEEMMLKTEIEYLNIEKLNLESQKERIANQPDQVRQLEILTRNIQSNSSKYHQKMHRLTELSNQKKISRLGIEDRKQNITQINRDLQKYKNILDHLRSVNIEVKEEFDEKPSNKKINESLSVMTIINEQQKLFAEFDAIQDQRKQSYKTLGEATYNRFGLFKIDYEFKRIPDPFEYNSNIIKDILADKIYSDIKEGFILDLSDFESINIDPSLQLMFHQLSILGCHTIYLNESLKDTPVIKKLGLVAQQIVYKKAEEAFIVEDPLIKMRENRWNDQLQYQLNNNPDFLIDMQLIQKKYSKIKRTIHSFEDIEENLQDLDIELEAEAEAEAETNVDNDRECQSQFEPKTEYETLKDVEGGIYYRSELHNAGRPIDNIAFTTINMPYYGGVTESACDYVFSKNHSKKMRSLLNASYTRFVKNSILSQIGITKGNETTINGIELSLHQGQLVFGSSSIQEKVDNIRLINQEKSTNYFSSIDQLSKLIIKKDNGEFSLDAIPQNMQDKINTFLYSYFKFSDKRIVPKLSYFIKKFEKTTEKSLAVLCYCMCLPEESPLNLNKIKSSLDETAFSNFLELLNLYSSDNTKINEDLIYLLKLASQSEISKDYYDHYADSSSKKGFIQYLNKIPGYQGYHRYEYELNLVEDSEPNSIYLSETDKEAQHIKDRFKKKYPDESYQLLHRNLERFLNVRSSRELFSFNLFNEMFKFNITPQFEYELEEVARYYQILTKEHSFTLQKKINHFLFDSKKNQNFGLLKERLKLLHDLKDQFSDKFETLLDIGFSEEYLRDFKDDLPKIKDVLELIKYCNLDLANIEEIVEKFNSRTTNFCENPEHQELIKTLFVNCVEKDKFNTDRFITIIDQLHFLKNKNLFLFQRIESFLEPDKKIDELTFSLIQELYNLLELLGIDQGEIVDISYYADLHKKIDIKIKLDLANTVAKKDNNIIVQEFFSKNKSRLESLNYQKDTIYFQKIYQELLDLELDFVFIHKINNLIPDLSKEYLETYQKFRDFDKEILDLWVLGTSMQDLSKSKDDLHRFRKVIEEDIKKEEDLIRNIKQISQLERDQGELGLLTEEKDLLVTLVKRFQTLVDSPFFEKATVEDLREKYRENRIKLSNLSKDSREYQEIYLETLAICSFMCMKNPSFGFAPKLTQISSVLLQLFHPRQVHEIATGEGKTLIMALHVMMSYAQGLPVEYLTSAPNLAQQTEENMRPILSLLNIPCVRLTSSQDTIPNDGVIISDVNTRILCSLKETGVGGSKQYENVRQLAKDKKFLIDEWDFPFYDIKTDFKIPKEIPDLKGMKYEVLYEKLGKLDLSKVKNKKEYIRKNLKDSIQELYSLNKKISKKEILKYKSKINQISDYILDDLIKAKETARVLEQKGLGQAYALTDHINQKGENIKYARPVLEGLIQYDSNFSLHVQQFLHYFLQQNNPESHFEITPPKEINAIHTVDTFMRYIMEEGSMIGVTGTIGSEKERKEIQERYKGTVFVGLPTYNQSKRTLSKDIKCDTEEEYIEQIIEEVTEFKKTRPVYLVCENSSRKTSLWFDQLQAEYPDTNIQICDERGRSTDGIHFNQWTDQEYSKMKDFAAQKENISIVTVGVGGRGIDITVIDEEGKPSDQGIGVIIADELSERSERQALGRTGRQGREGVYSKITRNQPKISKEADDYYIIEKRVTRDAFDFLSKNPLFKANWSSLLKKIRKESKILKNKKLTLKKYEQEIKKIRNKKIEELFKLKFIEPSKIKRSQSLDQKVLKKLQHELLTTTQEVNFSLLDLTDGEHYRDVIFINHLEYSLLSVDQREALNKLKSTKVIIVDEKTSENLDFMNLMGKTDPQTKIHIIGGCSFKFLENKLSRYNHLGRSIHVWPPIMNHPNDSEDLQQKFFEMQKFFKMMTKKGAALYLYGNDNPLDRPILSIDIAINSISKSAELDEKYYASLLGCEISCLFQNESGIVENQILFQNKANRYVHNMYRSRQVYNQEMPVKDYLQEDELISKLMKLDKAQSDFDIEFQIPTIDIKGIIQDYNSILNDFSEDKTYEITQIEREQLEKENINITLFNQKEYLTLKEDIEQLKKSRNALLNLRIENLLRHISNQNDYGHQEYQEIKNYLIKGITSHFQHYMSIHDERSLNKFLKILEMSKKTGMNLDTLVQEQEESVVFQMLNQRENYIINKKFDMNDPCYEKIEDSESFLKVLVQQYHLGPIQETDAFQNIGQLFQEKAADPGRIQLNDIKNIYDSVKNSIKNRNLNFLTDIKELWSRPAISIHDRIADGVNYYCSFEDCLKMNLKEFELDNEIFLKNSSFRQFCLNFLIKEQLKKRSLPTNQIILTVAVKIADVILYARAAFLYSILSLKIGFYKMMDKRSNPELDKKPKVGFPQTDDDTDNDSDLENENNSFSNKQTSNRAELEHDTDNDSDIDIDDPLLFSNHLENNSDIDDPNSDGARNNFKQ